MVWQVAITTELLQRQILAVDDLCLVVSSIQYISVERLAEVWLLLSCHSLKFSHGSDVSPQGKLFFNPLYNGFSLWEEVLF